MTSFPKEQLNEVSLMLHKVSLAKSLPVVDGALTVWIECMQEDMDKFLFDFEDFIEAGKKMIRTSVYGRIDYADIYSLAIETAYNKRMKKKLICDICGQELNYTYGEHLRCVLSDPRCKCSLEKEGYIYPDRGTPDYTDEDKKQYKNFQEDNRNWEERKKRIIKNTPWLERLRGQYISKSNWERRDKNYGEKYPWGTN